MIRILKWFLFDRAYLLIFGVCLIGYAVTWDSWWNLLLYGSAGFILGLYDDAVRAQ